VIEPENAGRDKQVNTSVHASVSSGGCFAIVPGFLVSAMIITPDYESPQGRLPGGVTLKFSPDRTKNYLA
jgi:hypothetical protein